MGDILHFPDLLPPVEPASWENAANCRGVDPDLFFPGRGESTAPAKAVCAGCTVRDDCLDAAIARSEKHGVWGGLSERERRRIRTQRRRNLTVGAIS